MNFDIKHDGKGQKFFTTVAGKECLLKYEKINESTLDYKLLYVPRNLRGQGLADRIAEVAIDFAKKNGLKIKASCSYVAKYMNSHKETLALVVS